MSVAVMHDTDEDWSALRHRMHTLTEAAGRLQVARLTLWRLIRAGDVPAVKIGTRWKVPGDWLVDTLRQGKDL